MNIRIVLIGSLILNLSLTLWLCRPIRGNQATADFMSSVPVSAPAQPHPTSLPRDISLANTNSPSPAFFWRDIESSDYPVYIANLRAVGCPEPVIQDIIGGELDELYTSKRQELLRPLQGQLWEMAAALLKAPNKMERIIGDTMRQTEKQVAALRKERSALFKELLGERANRPDRDQPGSGGPLAFLAEDKIASVRKIEDEYREQRRRTKAPAELEALARKKQDQLQQLLTPGEFYEYNLRTSSAASVRHRVVGVTATDDEWRHLVRIRQQFDEANPEPTGNSPEDRAKLKARREAIKGLDEQYKILLGPERFEAFERGQKPDFQQVFRVTRRCELPDSAAIQVFQSKQSFDAANQEISRDQNLDPEGRETAMAESRNRVREQIRAVLGERAFQTYLRYGGDWLKPRRKR